MKESLIQKQRRFHREHINAVDECREEWTTFSERAKEFFKESHLNLKKVHFLTIFTSMKEPFH